MPRAVVIAASCGSGPQIEVRVHSSVLVRCFRFLVQAVVEGVLDLKSAGLKAVVTELLI